MTYARAHVWVINVPVLYDEQLFLVRECEEWESLSKIEGTKSSILFLFSDILSNSI